MKEKIKQLFGLFGAFAVVGVTTFGGGYAMLPALQREVVEKRRWATEEEVMDWYAIGQCTPGVIAVNTATFVGQKQAGVWGGVSVHCQTAAVIAGTDIKSARHTVGRLLHGAISALCMWVLANLL